MAPRKTAAKRAPDEEDLADNPTVRTIWVVLAVLLGIAAILGVLYLTQGTETLEHNGFIFEEVSCPRGTCWQTNVVSNIGVHPITFYYNPEQLQDVPVDPAAVERVLNLTRTRNASVTFVFDEGVPGEVGLAAVQMARITGDRFYQIPTSGAVHGTVTCKDASAVRTVIYLVQAPVAGVALQDDCVHVTAPDADELLRVADAYAMSLLRILP